MGLDFDPIDYCRTLARTPSPFKCPVEKCNKSYKSIYGLQYHLVNYDHDTNQQISHITPSRKKGGSRQNTTSGGNGQKTSPIKAAQPSLASPKEGLTYLEAQKMVQFDIDGKSIKVSTVEPISMITDEEYAEMVAKGEATKHQDLPVEPHIKLPEATVKSVENYTICDAPQRPNAYIRFIEKSPEELDGEIEYDVDEEDTTWLQHINDRRGEAGVSAVSIDNLELLMDRLEKESYFQAAANGQSGAVVDDDAVCCICMDGECQNTNVILFCDMCNLAVHQDCYGVPYIPEGQWLCRRCLQSPSRPVDCVLCPNTGGAFKQTDHNQWAHVVCALWIPEVRFANTVFLEPIDSIEHIPQNRWRLLCYICKQKGVGACIQCQRKSCCEAFHVTCAQQAGLHMRMDTVKDSTNEAHPITVQKVAYCHKHCPTSNGGNGETPNLPSIEAEWRSKSGQKVKQARKMLAIKRESVPLILIPTIPADRVQEITSLVNFPRKAQFIQRLIAYWTLKRQHRNGVPLLRRLQSQGQTHSNRGIEGSPNASELNQQLKYWQCLRQDLERARLLCELVRKREKLKAAEIRIKEQCIMMVLNPLEAAMNRLLDSLYAKDRDLEIFSEPVDVDEVPDYMDVVKEPMDLSKMRKKLRCGEYSSIDEMEADFNLMIRNCLAYNNKDTIFYKAGTKMRDHGSTEFKSVRQELIRNGILEAPQSDDSLAREIDADLEEILKSERISEDFIAKLQQLEKKVSKLRHGMARAKRAKLIRSEIIKAKKLITRSNNSMESNATKNISGDGGGTRRVAGPATATNTESSQSEDEEEETSKAETVSTQQNTPPCSPIKLANCSASPSGVNRRTAVLFTRKAQAAASLKRSEPLLHHEESNSCDVVGGAPPLATSSLLLPIQIDTKIKCPKKLSRSRRNNSHSLESNSGLGDDSNANSGPPSSLLSATVLNASSSSLHVSKKSSPSMRDKYRSSDIISDSFRCYRDQEFGQSSDSDETHISYSDSCSSCSHNNSSDCCSSLDDDDDDEDDDSDFGPQFNHATSSYVSNSSASTSMSGRKKNDETTASSLNLSNGKSQTVSSESSNSTSAVNTTFEPLQLVWAKCVGYPWYPALIIDPKMPNGFIYNGVPLPTPPTDVLALRKDKPEPVFLVLFFDAKRTWQWLPPNKLELLGLNNQQDKSKLTESRKQSKAVKKAYEDALKYHSQVTDLEGQGPGAIM